MRALERPLLVRGEAEPFVLRTYEVFAAAYPEDQWEIEQAIQAAVELYAATNDSEQEILGRRRALPIRLRVAGPTELDNLVEKLEALDRLLRADRRDDEAETLVERLVEAADEEAPPGHPRRARYFGNLGRALIRLDRREQAEELLLESTEALGDSNLPGEDHPTVAERARGPL